MSAKPEIVADVETFGNLFYVGLKRLHDGKRIGFELSDRATIDKPRLEKILRAHKVITFNGQPYDLPMIYYALEEGVTNAKLMAASNRIIQGQVKYWEVEKMLGIRIPKLDHIDLIEPQPNPFAGLKVLNGRLHGRTLQDLPYEVGAMLTHEQMDQVIAYNDNDLAATELLYKALKEPLELREALGAEYGADFRSKSDSQIGEAIVKSRVEHLTGERPQKVATAPGSTFRYPVPDFLRFETPELQDVLDRLRETDFVVAANGKVDLPKWLSATKITLGSSTYAMGIGGLHSTESNRSVHSDDEFALVDADVASMYPAIILLLGLFPKALGKHFSAVYRGIKDGRINAKHRAKEIKALLKTFVGTAEERTRLEIELFACTVKDKGLKIALNGVFGKLGSTFSILYAPHLLLSTTLTGQLTLLMLIERAVRRGIDVVSGNTDGVLFKVPRKWFAGVEKDRLNACFLSEITEQWERDTGFDLEFVEYLSIYNQHVNSYYAFKTDGGHKRKGPQDNPWCEHPDDHDPRKQLMKNPQMTICSDAVLAFIKDGVPLEETICGCRDIRQFVTVIKATTGATWRGEYLGKVVRYIWGTDGDPILLAKPHETTGNFKKVPKTDGARPMMVLPDEFPTDIDYARYVLEAQEILMDFGGAQRPPEPPKFRRGKPSKIEMLYWALVA